VKRLSQDRTQPAVAELARGGVAWIHDAASWQRLDGERAADELLASAPATWLRRVAGRETFVWPFDAPAAVVKRYAGLDRREWWHELLHRGVLGGVLGGALGGALGRGGIRPAARIEADNLAALARAGFPVPKPIAALARGSVSVVAMELVRHDTDLASALAEAPRERRDAWLAELAELVARLHTAGFCHRDLYFQHVVLPREPRAGSSFVLLDCGRVREGPRLAERWFVKDLAALAHSLNAAVGADEWRAFVARYVSARPESGELERTLCAVEAKRARLAAHAPRFVDPAGGKRSCA
jgi:tRNA A-37 threonylcarbamoyl transferase component Bud32